MKTQTVQLGEVCKFIYGEALKEENRCSGKVPVYGSNGVVGWHDKALTSGTTIVIGRKGSIGEINWSNGPCFPIDTTYYVEKTERPCDLRWLYYTLLKLDLTRLNKSAAVPGLNRDDAYEQHILFPDVPEQERIAALLDQADRLRRTRRYALELTGTFLPAAFLEFFGDPVRNERGWRTDILESVATKITDGEHLNPQFVPMGFPIVMAEQVDDWGVNLVACKRVSAEDFTKFIRKCEPVKQDILIVSRGATIGRTCVVNTENPFCMMGSVILIKPDSNVVNPYFLSALLKSASFLRVLRTTSGASAQQAIYIANLKDKVVVVPPLSLQHKFAALVERVDHLRAAQREALRQAEHLFASLLHRAFSG
jgi:type I restriction enzyme, S subunit